MSSADILMNKTPQYDLIFNLAGSRYSASADRETMVVIDNQLETLSSVVGDGVLSGWTLSASGPLTVQVSLGTGFITSVLNKTLSNKVVTVADDATSSIYLQSTMMSNPGGFQLEIESSLSSKASSTFVDTTPPADPTSLAPLSRTEVLFDQIGLTWDENTDPDFDHYQLWRLGPVPATSKQLLSSDPIGPANRTATITTAAPHGFSVGQEVIVALNPADSVFDTLLPTTVTSVPNATSFTYTVSYASNIGVARTAGTAAASNCIDPECPSAGYVKIAEPTANGTIASPYFDNNLQAGTSYSYRLYAVDISGNRSGSYPPIIDPPIIDITDADARIPSEASNLRLLPGDGQIAVAYDPSPSLVSKYLIAVDQLNPDGTIVVGPGTYIVDNGTSETAQLTIGILNTWRYRITVKVQSPVGNISDGIAAEAVPSSLPSPLDISALTSTPIVGGITLNWTASASPAGPSIGNRSAYLVTVFDGGVSSDPIDVGLATQTTIQSYLLPASVGFGLPQFFSDQRTYLFSVVAQDSFGNQSGGVFVKGKTIDVTPPKNPRALSAVADDTKLSLSWTHSVDADVAGYNVAYSGVPPTSFSPDVMLPYVTFYEINGLDNGTPYTVRIRARDASGNLSSGTYTVGTPFLDTAPPDIPTQIQVTPQDGQVSMSWQASTATDVAYYMVQRSAVLGNSPNIPPNQTVSLDPDAPLPNPAFINVGLSTSLMDTGLINGHMYSYSVQAVDTHSNPSGYSVRTLTVPSEGLNQCPYKIDRPTVLLATFAYPNIHLAWSFSYPSPECSTWVSGGEPTAFNIYRSTNPTTGFQLIASTLYGTNFYDDPHLVSGLTYYYMVSAVRDNAVVIADTGTIQPTNSILIGTVKAVAGNMTVSNTQRIVDGLLATLTEQTTSRLLAHRHLAAPSNTVSATALATLPMVEAMTITADSLASLTNLSPAAMAYYASIVAKFGTQAHTYTTYVIAPTSVIYNVPFVGDFQILVDGARPTVPILLDESINAIVFTTPLKSNNVLSLDGLGMSYYVPARLDRDYYGFEIQVDGSPSATAMIDKELQTVRFVSPLASTNVVAAVIEPVVPTFATNTGPRQVSLSPNIVLNDFVPANQTTYVSQSGGFYDTDVFFVLVNGERTVLDNYVDTAKKSIVFSSPLAVGTVVSLEIRGREEVQGTLNASRFGSLDASQVTTGELNPAQLPTLSHEGRVREGAFPISATLPSTNGYTYAAVQGTLGSATTPYAIAQNKDSNLLFGTSTGLLRTFVSGLLVGQDSNVQVNPNVPIVSSNQFQEDQLIDRVINARTTSGRISGTVILNVHAGTSTYTVNLTDPSGCLLSDGRAFLCGGNSVKDAYIYDPATHQTKKVAQMSVCRAYHTCTSMPNGRVLVTGGRNQTVTSYVLNPSGWPDGTAKFAYLQSFEVFDPITETWQPPGNMKQARYNHAADVLNENDVMSEVLIAGGSWAYIDVNQAGNFKYDEIWDSYTDRDFYQYEDLDSAEKYNIAGSTFYTTSMPNAFQVTGSKMDHGLAVVDGPKFREIYDPVPETWQTGQAPVTTPFVGADALDGPIKQFLLDNDNDCVFAVTRANIFVSKNGGGYWDKMKGLDAVGVVHRIAMDTDKTLYAATDLGVYEMPLAARDVGVWFQGGLLGAGTTETFDLFQFDPIPTEHGMFAATEIGLFYSSDGGQTWSNPDSLPSGPRGISIDDVYNIETLGTSLFIQAGQAIYKSSDGGMTWARTTILSFADRDSKLISRPGLDMFMASSVGLYVTHDGTAFELVDYDMNRNSRINNIHMADLLGTDLVVGYDNLAITVGPDYKTQVLAAWTGTIPTVYANGTEVRTGFRYDIKNSLVVFEDKRLAEDVVTMASNYSLYAVSGGGWYAQNPDTTVLVYVNDKEQSATYDSKTGQIALASPLEKSDIVTVSVAATTLKDGGQYFHTELEDNLSRGDGLPLYMSMDNSCNILQAGLSIEHNFLERGRLRTEYCDIDGMVDRSMNSFLPYSEFAILGRKEFDRFNSTIDYLVESSQQSIGKAALVCNSVLEISSSEVWLATDKGVFVIDPTMGYEVSETFDIGPAGTPVLCLYEFPYPSSNSVWAATPVGLFTVTPGLSGRTVAKNLGAGLPGVVHTLSSVNNVLVAGTDDGAYYSEDVSNPSYGIWLKASFAASSVEIFVTDPCTSMVVKDGTVFASASNLLFRSTNGKEWERVYEFTDGTLIVTMAVFANKLFLGTTAGIWNDNSSAKTNTVTFSLEPVYNDPDTDGSLHINDMFSTSDSLYAVGSFPTVLIRKNESWSKETVTVSAIHKISILSSGGKVAVSNNQVLVE